MPEGDTLHRTAAGLRPYLVGRTVTAARTAARAPAAGRPARRPARSRRRGPGQEPADPLRQRPRAAHPPAHERLVASLPAGRALAPAAVSGTARARGPGAVAVCFDAPVVELFEDALRPSTRLCPASDRTSCGPDFELRKRSAAPRPGARRSLDRRRAARPAGARRRRQHLAQRDAVRRAGRPARAGRRPRRRHAPPDCRDGPPPADGECRDRPGAQRPDAAASGARDGRVRGAGQRSDRTSSAANPRTTYWCPSCQIVRP